MLEEREPLHVRSQSREKDSPPWHDWQSNAPLMLRDLVAR